MSGGHFEYDQHRIADICDKLHNLIDNPDDLEYYKFSPETVAEFKRGLDILKKAFVYAHRIDYLVSADDGEETFHERLKEDLENLK